jgi:hypothetical protein
VHVRQKQRLPSPDCPKLFTAMRYILLLALSSGSLATADTIRPTALKNLVERKVATCHMNDPGAGTGDPWRTGTCKRSKWPCRNTGGEPYRYEDPDDLFRLCVEIADGCNAHSEDCPSGQLWCCLARP